MPTSGACSSSTCLPISRCLLVSRRPSRRAVLPCGTDGGLRDPSESARDGGRDTLAASPIRPMSRKLIAGGPGGAGSDRNGRGGLRRLGRRGETIRMRPVPGALLLQAAQIGIRQEALPPECRDGAAVDESGFAPTSPFAAMWLLVLQDLWRHLGEGLEGTSISAPGEAADCDARCRGGCRKRCLRGRRDGERRRGRCFARRLPFDDAIPLPFSAAPERVRSVDAFLDIFVFGAHELRELLSAANRRRRRTSLAQGRTCRCSIVAPWRCLWRASRMTMKSSTMQRKRLTSEHVFQQTSRPHEKRETDAERISLHRLLKREDRRPSIVSQIQQWMDEMCKSPLR